jgi:hypothetical protein
MIKKIEMTEISFDKSSTLRVWRDGDTIKIKKLHSDDYELIFSIGETRDLINILTQYCERKKDENH